MMTFATAANQHQVAAKAENPITKWKKNKIFATENIPGTLARFAQQ